eukprot:GILJ01009918.1.p1 GENE.GILJ01009918.1~~GILJ01009918.1.p1  ORF type:complete len:158 (-),score=1.30 GILJ01009918.1:1155-1628(-)
MSAKHLPFDVHEDAVLSSVAERIAIITACVLLWLASGYVVYRRMEISGLVIFLWAVINLCCFLLTYCCHLFHSSLLFISLVVLDIIGLMNLKYIPPLLCVLFMISFFSWRLLSARCFAWERHRRSGYASLARTNMPSQGERQELITTLMSPRLRACY